MGLLAGNVERFITALKAGSQELTLQPVIAAAIIQETVRMFRAIENQLFVFIQLRAILAGNATSPERPIHDLAGAMPGPIVPIPFVNIRHELFVVTSACRRYRCLNSR